MYRIVLRGKDGIDATLADVGFGISQIVPVIAQSLAFQNETIAIEQPELHIHPRLQAEIADVFIQSSQSLGNRFVIETHSEHLILRIRRRIREGTLDHRHVAVLYVMPTDSGPQLRELRLDAEGDFIDSWPDGFFEEDFRELFS